MNESVVGPAMGALEFEAIKAAFSLGVAWLALWLGSGFWHRKQKLRELNLASANEFHRLYGEFFAVWQLWKYTFKQSRDAGSHAYATLFDRACTAEGQVEALLVRLASSRQLSVAQIESPRVSRRLNSLRGLSHEQVEQVLARGT